MSKHHFEFKLQIVQAYINGEGGYRYLSKKFGLTNTAQLRKWVNAYKEFGNEGLLRKRVNKKYSSEFKASVVESYLTSELSLQQIALQYGLNNPALVSRWKNEFMQHGANAFVEKQKGRPPTMKKEGNKQVKKNRTTRISKKKLSELTPDQLRILELEKQLRYAQIENAYLKELRRLRLEDARKMKEQQESLAVSEENLS